MTARPDIAQGYTGQGGELRNNVAMHGVSGSAAGGGYSTALDLLTYVKALQAGKLPGANTQPAIAGARWQATDNRHGNTETPRHRNTETLKTEKVYRHHRRRRHCHRRRDRHGEYVVTTQHEANED